ncbi:MAG: PorT family protein [candidate division KSB1 bacterium]|nr:PorT family protein [candidate division KSB1 bacterium]
MRRGWPMVRAAVLALALAGSPSCLAGTPLGVRGVSMGVAGSAFRRHDTAVLWNGAFGVWGEKRLAPHAALLWEVNYTTLGGVLRDKAMYGAEGIYAYDFTLRWAFIEMPIVLAFEVPFARNWKGLFFSGPSLLLFQRDLSRTEKGSYLHPWEPGERWEYVWLYEYRPLEIHKKRLGYHIGIGISGRVCLLSIDYFQMDDEVADLVSSIYRVDRRIQGLRLMTRWDLTSFVRKEGRP